MGKKRKNNSPANSEQKKPKAKKSKGKGIMTQNFTSPTSQQMGQMGQNVTLSNGQVPFPTYINSAQNQNMPTNIMYNQSPPPPPPMMTPNPHQYNLPGNLPVTPVSQTSYPSETSINQVILNKLESIESRQQTMERRLDKLDIIENQVTNLSQKFNQMETRLSSLESKLYQYDRKLNEIEASRHFDSQTCDEIKSKQVDIDLSLKTETLHNTRLASRLEEVNDENNRLNENLLDLQSRTMRDNLLFFNFDECVNENDRKSEDCTEKIFSFCEDTLQMQDVRTTVKIDRAHRIGRFNPNKKRPIVTKFNYFRDKVDVKQLVQDKSESTQIRVGDQYPKIIQDRRKKLIPLLKKAKDENKHAVLSYDKLYINGKTYTADMVPSTFVPPGGEPMATNFSAY